MQKQKKHLLLVDDVTTNLKCLGEILKEEYSLSMAKSGEQALQLMKRIHPDLVMLDVKMPVMDGYETMRRMLEDPDCCDIPVIFLTADRENSSELKGLRLGARDFIRKPFEPEVMLSRIERVLLQEDRNRAIVLASQKDALTGLWNREYLRKEIERMVQEGIPGSFMIFDLDNFKGINDTYGHVIGDEALIAFARTLNSFVHKDDIVARIGGDEFVIFLKNSVGEELLGNRIAGLIEEVEEQIKVVKEDDKLSSVSVGISALPKDGKSFTELYNNADKALYYVKRNGKNGFHFYSDQDRYNFMDEDSSLVDLSQLKEFIDEKEEEAGPFHVSYDSFKDIYQFLKRYVARTKSKVQLLLFTVKDLSLTVTDEENVAKGMETLEKAICKSLRKNDISTIYSKSQYLVILMDVDDKNRSVVLDRIINNFNAQNDNENLFLKYDIEAVDSEGV